MKNITVHSNEKTEYEFNLTSTGVVLDTGKVFFLIKLENDVSIRIDCNKKKGQTWVLSIPEKTLKDGSYNYTVCAIVEHYYFEAYTGKIDVLSDSSFSIEPVQTSDESKEVDEHQQKDIPQKADENENKPKNSKKGNKKVNEQTGDSEVDVVVKQPIKEASAPVISRPIFNFNTIKHPYTTLKDNGETDKKVREALQRLKLKD